MRIRRRVILASQVLPAAGATVDGLTYDVPTGAVRLVFWITYTGASGTSRPAFALTWSNDTELVSREIVIDETTFAVGVAPNATFQFYSSLPSGVAPGNGVEAEYILEFNSQGGKRQVTLSMVEFGDTDNPGTIEAALTGSGPP